MPRPITAVATALATLVLAAPAAAQDAPACDPATQPAALLNAPDRLAYGRQGVARAVDGPGETVVEQALIGLGDAPPVPGPVRFEQDLDDPPLRIRMLVTERTATTRCGRLIEHTVRGFRRIVVAQGCHGSAFRPRRLAQCTVDWGWRASRLRWSGWNRDVARARGRWHEPCVPVLPPRSCAAPSRARFTLSRIRWCGTLEGYVYTRMRVRRRGEPVIREDIGCPQIFDGVDG